MSNLFFENMTEKEARDQILEMVGAYCDAFHNIEKPFYEGDRIPYASRVYDREEMTNLVDSALEFWLTAGRYTERFEKGFAGNLIKHPCFDQMRKSGEGYRVIGDLINTDRIMRDTFWIGVYPGMTEEKLGYMAKILKEAVGKNR